MKELLSGYAIKKEIFDRAGAMLGGKSSPGKVEDTIVKLSKDLSYPEQLRVAETWPNHYREALRITKNCSGKLGVASITYNLAKDILLNEYSNWSLAA